MGYFIIHKFLPPTAITVASVVASDIKSDFRINSVDPNYLCSHAYRASKCILKMRKEEGRSPIVIHRPAYTRTSSQAKTKPSSPALPATATATEKLFLVEMVITRLVTHAMMSDGAVVSPPPVTAATALTVT